jgi:hypothetical protein
MAMELRGGAGARGLLLAGLDQLAKVAKYPPQRNLPV